MKSRVAGGPAPFVAVARETKLPAGAIEWSKAEFIVWQPWVFETLLIRSQFLYDVVWRVAALSLQSRSLGLNHRSGHSL
jgi:hypothetical protein